MKRPYPFWALVLLFSILGLPILCASTNDKNPFVVILGITQDGGYPHAGCRGECCADAWKDISRKRMVSCLAIFDPASNERWLFDATPDFIAQLHLLDDIHPLVRSPAEKSISETSQLGITGILLTHAHIGHCTGLMYLGREGLDTKNVPVYAMSRMREFLRTSGPWSQLVNLNNIELRPLENGVTVELNERISVTPFRVPHRDEYSETVGYIVKGPTKTFVFIPDIDKWEKWTT